MNNFLLFINSKPFQVFLQSLIVTAQCFIVTKRPDLVPVFTPGLAILAGGLGFTLHDNTNDKDVKK